MVPFHEADPLPKALIPLKEPLKSMKKVQVESDLIIVIEEVFKTKGKAFRDQRI